MNWLQTPAIVIPLIGALVAVSAALAGVFLVLRQSSMISDAISHSVLFGIVVAFLLVPETHSPWLLVGAASAGLLTVLATQSLVDSRLVKEDAAIGLVFPTLFAAGVLLINLYADRVHLDTHAVLLGELAFSWMETVPIAGYEVPRSLVYMAVVTAVLGLYVGLFFKELKLVAFDPALAEALGLHPRWLYNGLLALSSVATVAAFDAVGAVLLVAFLIVPAAAAYLLVDHVGLMLLLACAFGVTASVTGYLAANVMDVSIGGMMATMTGVILLLSFLFAPRYGLIASRRRRWKQKLRLEERHLLIHLYTHEQDDQRASIENTVLALHTHLMWSDKNTRAVLERALDNAFVTHDDGRQLVLTEAGRALARQTVG